MVFLNFFFSESIIAMYNDQDAPAVFKVFSTKVENCGLIPESDLLEIAAANGSLSKYFREENELNKEDFMKLIQSVQSNATDAMQFEEEMEKLQRAPLSYEEKVFKMARDMDFNRDMIVGCDEFVKHLVDKNLA